jgi:hypothetical protein
VRVDSSRPALRPIATIFWRHGMSTSADKPIWPKKSKEPEPPHAYLPATALAQTVDFDDDMMRVTFIDGRVLAVPLALAGDG